MTCRRCQGCMARDHFLDLHESGGDSWLEGWRCINCGHVFDAVIEKNRQLHAASLSVAHVAPPAMQPAVAEAFDQSVDMAA